MNRPVAFTLSVVFHPVFINLLSLVLLIELNPYLEAVLTASAKWFYIMYVFITTALLPLFVVVLRKALGFSPNILLERSDDRHIPYIVTSCAYLFGYYLFLRIGSPAPLIAYMLASASVMVLILSINFFTKISAHATSLGAITGVLIACQSFTDYDLRWLIVIVLLLSGITTTARLALKAHTTQQIYSGFALGLVVMWYIL